MTRKPEISSEILGSLGAIEDWIPKYGHPVTKYVQHLEGSRFMVTLVKRGVPFEVHENVAIERMFDRDTETYSKLGRDLGGRLGYHATFTRRRVRFDRVYRFSPRFMQWFSREYVGRFNEDRFYENRYYLSLILKYDDFDDGLKEIESLAQQALLQFADYEAELLEVYERQHMNGTKMLFSKLYGFISDLVNAVWTDVPVAAEPGTDVIPSSWLHFGYNTVAIRGPGVPPSRQFATCHDLRGFPDKPGWGQLNSLLTLPMEFTITQSFNCMTGFEANRTVDSAINKLESAGDKAKHQVRELREAQGYVNTGELSFGDYHGAVVIYGETAKEAIANGDLFTSRSLNECGVEWMIATGSAPFTYFSQVPGAKVKPRPKVQSSRNFAAMHACHDYSTGKAEGNPVGDGSAIIPFRTNAGNVFNFNFHATRLGDVNVSEKLAGHFEAKGTTGTGKTTLIAAAIAMSFRFEPLLYVLDKGRGWEVFIRTMGGAYVYLEKGKPTGWAPFELADTPENREFLYGLVELCGRRNGVDLQGKPIRIDLSAAEKMQCRNAVDAVMDIDDVRLRRFSLLLDSIPDEGDDSLRARLSIWCKSEGGRFWWVFDNPPNLSLNMSGQRCIGFDVEAFLVENYEPSEPAFAWLFHLKRLMRKEGALMATIIEEYWLPIRFRTIREQIEETLASGRKEGEFIGLVTQQPEQAQKAADLYPALRSLVATKIYLADPAAEEAPYLRDGMTRKEFREFRKLTPQSHRFLIKQGNQSAFATFDLSGLDDAIAVFSGDRENVLILDGVRAEMGDDPDAWLPVYLLRVFERRQRTRLTAKHGADEQLWMSELRHALGRKRAELAAIYPPVDQEVAAVTAV
ncbi:CagE TrbE VirB component of type IV transporter system [Paraburkholderia piptadeniae]|uniref:CagE TrbE VirB component of type IV transporter system n=1 Tax=Paraburkholderia piptadeniae TaxID=1701573 RepID=A0A1N7STI6_9BURK|nr:VirB4 family type IV secretion system protein [Paraburkholderia piptadeniae]SIT50783.1 CagE TrbE VirB component of type IV transporter system [Paraburkholderia piptadeniae]